ncbi:hypothetical protein J7U46_13890 [Pelomonas sp. V22]|uniref:hypothetical protein n=1 Tax=Pelomonas sp. V22 TaxID=2822139 RepID=UPI0024A95B44|nr:hypothetical protein [Pelomonas sp. V22]MDI4634145.1 hypothetical protein [Pelomonas sp. V22]
MSKTKAPRDPRGHSLRIYADVFDSPAYCALSPHDRMAYMALLRELKGYNNGDLSLPLSRAKKCGISHHLTLARSLRAVCAVGLVAITRKGGCTKGGQRLPTLYRITDRECYDIPAKHLEARQATNEWRKVQSVEAACALIEKAEQQAKASGDEKKGLGHRVTRTRTPRDVVSPKTRTPGGTWDSGPGHRVTVAETCENPIATRDSDRFSSKRERSSHRTPRVSPLYLCHPLEAFEACGPYQRLTKGGPNFSALVA